jgi:O-antigen ligase
VICSNALALAIFGTLQKLVDSTGPFFGLATVQQPYFFASFVYHNHWGAFTILMTTACLGLTWHFVLRREGRRDLLHSPVLGALVAILFLATTVPLSGSRSCTVLQAGLLGGALLHGTARFIRQRRQYKESVALPLVGALAAVSICIAGILYIAQDMIAARIAKTEWEFSNRAVRSGAVGRPVLYRDTWHMARDRLWFGWGMASYPEVFEFYNSQDIGPIDHLPVRYVDAHNDWLQSLAEHGLVGTAALGLCALVPLWTLKRHPPRSQLPKYPLVGCGIILFYALVEFPFGNTAVVLTWWILFFAAVRYAELQHASSSAPAPA